MSELTKPLPWSMSIRLYGMVSGVAEERTDAPCICGSSARADVDRLVPTVSYGRKRAFQNPAPIEVPASQGCKFDQGLYVRALVSRRTPMADKGSDLVVLWQKMIGGMEKGLNAFAAETMTSPEFSQAMNRAGGITAGAQKQLGEFLEKYLLNMNLPSRTQVVGLAERLQSIETQIAEIKATLQQMNAAAGGAQGG